jgi:hypothetical protein
MCVFPTFFSVPYVGMMIASDIGRFGARLRRGPVWGCCLPVGIFPQECLSEASNSFREKQPAFWRKLWDSPWIIQIYRGFTVMRIWWDMLVSKCSVAKTTWKNISVIDENEDSSRSVTGLSENIGIWWAHTPEKGTWLWTLQICIKKTWCPSQWYVPILDGHLSWDSPQMSENPHPALRMIFGFVWKQDTRYTLNSGGLWSVSPFSNGGRVFGPFSDKAPSAVAICSSKNPCCWWYAIVSNPSGSLTFCYG